MTLVIDTEDLSLRNTVLLLGISIAEAVSLMLQCFSGHIYNLYSVTCHYCLLEPASATLDPVRSTAQRLSDGLYWLWHELQPECFAFGHLLIGNIQDCSDEFACEKPQDVWKSISPARWPFFMSPKSNAVVAIQQHRAKIA